MIITLERLTTAAEIFEQQFESLDAQARSYLYNQISEAITQAQEAGGKILLKSPEEIEKIFKAGMGYIEYDTQCKPLYFISGVELGEDSQGRKVVEMGGFVRLKPHSNSGDPIIPRPSVVAFQNASHRISNNFPDARLIATARASNVFDILKEAGYSPHSFFDNPDLSRISCDEGCSGNVNIGIQNGIAQCRVMCQSDQIGDFGTNKKSDSCHLMIFQP
jgi:hypothetical protein